MENSQPDIGEEFKAQFVRKIGRISKKKLSTEENEEMTEAAPAAKSVSNSGGDDQKGSVQPAVSTLKRASTAKSRPNL